MTTRALFRFLLLALVALQQTTQAFRGHKGMNRPHEVGVNENGQFHRRVDKVDEPRSRKCEISESSDEVEFKCKTETEEVDTEIEDSIEYDLKTSTLGLVIKVEYEQEIEQETEDLTTETETKYSVIFHKLIEFEKAEGAPATEGYDFENDLVLQEFPLDSWGPMNGVEDDGTVATFSVSSGDGMPTAIFTFTISRADVNETITANKIKIDFDLQDFPWTEGTESYVALLSMVESKREITVENEETNEKEKTEVIISFDDVVDTVGYVPFGEYTWAETAQVNGTESTVAVVATSPASPSFLVLGDSDVMIDEIAFAFVGENAQGASDIYWDPEAGIGYKSSAITRSIFPSAMLVLGGAAAFLLL